MLYWRIHIKKNKNKSQNLNKSWEWKTQLDVQIKLIRERNVFKLLTMLSCFINLMFFTTHL